MKQRYEVLEWHDEEQKKPKLCKPYGEHVAEEIIKDEAVAAGVMPKEASIHTYKALRQKAVGHMFQAPPRKPMMERVEALEAKVAELEKRVEDGYRRLELMNSTPKEVIGKPHGFNFS